MLIEERVGHLTDYDPETLSALVHIDRGVLHQGDQIHLHAPGIDLEERLDELREHGRFVSEGHQGEDVRIRLIRPLRRLTTDMLDHVKVSIIHDPYRIEDGAVLADLFA